ncbi:hypothetical protein CSAL01_12606 [Colletotrichum salicis]|uniref:Alcohol dehydrogenase-like N-terminal domain-containing protein n=1 Tax=Colletotrichum salicis TaxID=1209931 RepID=A0A135TZH7_9PEZI|nr:hypothetical protein CSAL01_12606 [Colletotrichum salicis]
MQNPSWFLYGPGSAKIVDRPTPTPKNELDVVVWIRYFGVCGSDVHFWKEGGFQRKASDEKPIVMGHEASGTIDAVESGVTSVKTADIRFVSGWYSWPTPPDSHGALTKYFIVPEDFVYKVPDEVSLQEAVLVEPTSVAVQATRLAEINYGQDVVVTGCGTIGLLCAAVAKAFGARRVIFGRYYTGQARLCAHLPRLRREHKSTIQTGIFLLKAGGSYVQAGLGKAKPEVPMLVLSEKELRVRGCFRYGSGDYELALSLIAEGKVKPKAMLSSVTPFETAILAWDKTARGEGVKNLIEGVKD